MIKVIQWIGGTFLMAERGCEHNLGPQCVTHYHQQTSQQTL